eukprot:8433947-Ditylum_brightwellii.AAC.1
MNGWKLKFQTVIADATKNLCGEKIDNESEASLSSASNYVSAVSRSHRPALSSRPHLLTYT